MAKSQSEWKEAVTLMKELDLKPKFQSLQAWNWASATVRNYFMFNDSCLDCKLTTASNSSFFSV